MVKGKDNKFEADTIIPEPLGASLMQHTYNVLYSVNINQFLLVQIYIYNWDNYK